MFFLTNAEIPLGFSDDKVRFIWQTDTHIQAGQNAQYYLNVSNAINDLHDWKPNAFIITGDVGDNYVQNVREAFTLLNTARRPKIICNGNHDEEEATLGAGNPNTIPLEGKKIFNRNAPFYFSTKMISGDQTLKALCIVLDNNIYDDDPNGITVSENHDPGDRFGWTETKTDWWKRFSPDCLTWLDSELAANNDCQVTLVFVHAPPAGMTFTNWNDLVDIFQTDGRPTIGFCGHVHEDATTYNATSTDESLTIPFYKAPAALDSKAWTRVTLSYLEGNIVIDEMLVKNFTNPGEWTINAPFTLEGV